ncbi:MAG: isoprenylcysteine carboxylmethyltransferase family protein [Gammaproteobacteria bacterium]|nr:isoprenylcysteine carboxylmethyltransferase family protein [Gammaproteobacteria bacterium]
MNVTTKDRTIKTSAWFLYTLIVLEILFMVSPFAAYYYSIYATPLNALQESQYTAWLTMYLLPHFTFSDSWLANSLILISWPLILLGIVLFVFGFCQIYWSKITGKGAVEEGLYRFIRHPQYVALAVIGLGSSFYWSRFIVVIAFVSMLCLYYFLARVEERICLVKFGESYREYLERTGMFLPRAWEAHWRSLDWRLPEVPWVRVAVIAGLYAAVLSLTVGFAFLLRSHVIDSLQTNVGESQVTVFLAPVSPQTRTRVAALLDAAELQADIVYVAPSSWQIPELGLIASTTSHQGGSIDELFHPTTHGNTLSFAQDRLNVVLAQATYVDGEVQGIERLTQALNVRPIQFADLELAAGQIVETRVATDSQWAGIPVPTF